MQIELFNYNLPKERIAQYPATNRDQSKLLTCQANGRLGAFTSSFNYKHGSFFDIKNLLNENDLLVFNDVKVLPVRIFGFRLNEDSSRGGHVEALLLKLDFEKLDVVALLHLSATVKHGMKFLFEPGLIAEVTSSHDERLKTQGEVKLKLSGMQLSHIGLKSWLERYGHVPLPPYIERKDEKNDKSNYQTIYASQVGAAAAPTAGFHFSSELLSILKKQGIQMGFVTLYVGLGTFRPIKCDNIDDHKMHEEFYEISDEFSKQYQSARVQGSRIVAVGTTVVRTLESWLSMADSEKTKHTTKVFSSRSTNLEQFLPGRYCTKMYIRPGYQFCAVDDLITNFHLPKTSLLVLVTAAMGSIDEVKTAYTKALECDYRFLSYGDAMFIRGMRR